MRPEHIIIIRHGESEANVDKTVYARCPDHRIELTARGLEQSCLVGRELRKFLGDRPPRFFYSPYVRSRMTLDGILESFPDMKVRCDEEPRIREQDWGHLVAVEEMKKIREQREAFGSFYFRLPDGESCADVYDRVSTFLETLNRAFEKESFEKNLVIVSHGITMRLFLMRWYHWTVARFEKLEEPDNCRYIVMKRSQDQRYRLLAPDAAFPGRVCFPGG